MGARAAQDFPLSVVARPAGNHAVQRHIDGVRECAGIGVISKYDTGRRALKTLRANGALGVLPDQYAWPDGVLLPMFGHPTRFVTSLARLALMSGAPILPAFGVRRTPWLADGRIVATVGPQFEVKTASTRARDEVVLEGTRRVVAELENIIRLHRDQWLWMHRRWREEDF
jgi:KDO2-lipid IV(A) lauroyltransferase